ncbi:MAG: cysteine desulfurase [Emcibacter sp.]|nr:cysteine desulfurase [Emcibacter sp.]
MMSALKFPLYLDNQATTPLDPRVLKAMMPYFTEKFGNPHSLSHAYGWEALAGVDMGRRQVADLIGAEPDEIIFTSGATESNNLAIKGIAYAAYPQKNHIITVATEHSSLLECFKTLERSGFLVTYLPVNKEGLINLDDLSHALQSKTSLVSVMAVNNEIGVIQDIYKIAEICAERDIIFHTDAAQAVGKISLDVGASPIDLLSISGHKTYGPKGVGALYISNHSKLSPFALFDGGGQERGFRSGTLSPALCAGLGAACDIARTEMTQDYDHIAHLAEKIKTSLLKECDGISLNGSDQHRYPGNLNFTLKDVTADQLIKELRNIAFSSGSACASGKVETSHVLRALDLSKDQIKSSFRLGLGRMTTVEEVDFAVGEIIQAVQKIRKKL